MGTDSDSDLDIVQMWRKAEGALDRAVAGPGGHEPATFISWRWIGLALVALFAILIVAPSFAQNVVLTGRGIICNTPDEVRAFIELDDIRKVNAKLGRTACGMVILEYTIDYDVDKVVYYGKAATITKITVMGLEIGGRMIRATPPGTQYTIFITENNGA